MRIDYSAKSFYYDCIRRREVKVKEYDTLTYQQAIQHLKDVFNAETFAKLDKAIRDEIRRNKDEDAYWEIEDAD